MSKSIKIILLVIMAAALLYLAVDRFSSSPLIITEPPEIIEREIIVEVPVEVVKEIEVIKTEVVEVQIVQEVLIELEDWESVEELEAFLAEDDTDSRIYLKAGPDGVIELYGQCEDSALQLRDRAAARGKHLSVVPLDRWEYHRWRGEWLKPGEYHAVCMARIGNEFHYIEPSTDEVWLALYLD